VFHTKLFRYPYSLLEKKEIECSNKTLGYIRFIDHQKSEVTFNDIPDSTNLRRRVILARHELRHRLGELKGAENIKIQEMQQSEQLTKAMREEMN